VGYRLRRSRHDLTQTPAPRPQTTMKGRIVYAVYLAAVMVATVGWIWLIVKCCEWIFGL
jgi:hypothetical protein